MKGGTPSGVKWEAYLALMTTYGTMQRLFALPPGAPPAAVDVAARRAHPSRQGSGIRRGGDQARWVTCPNTTPTPDTNQVVRAALTVRPEIRTFVADYIKAGGGDTNP